MDVCAIVSDAGAPAVAALGRDGTLVLVRDAFRPESPVTRKFRTIQGTAYRVLSSGEDLFVLTSRGLYALMKLGGQVVQGMPPAKVGTQILTIRVEAADVNLVGTQWLVAVTPDAIQRFSMPSIVARAEGKPNKLAETELSEAQAEALTPDWERYEISETSTRLAPTG